MVWDKKYTMALRKDPKMNIVAMYSIFETIFLISNLAEQLDKLYRIFIFKT